MAHDSRKLKLLYPVRARQNGDTTPRLLPMLHEPNQRLLGFGTGHWTRLPQIQDRALGLNAGREFGHLGQHLFAETRFMLSIELGPPPNAARRDPAINPDFVVSPFFEYHHLRSQRGIVVQGRCRGAGRRDAASSERIDRARAERA